LRIGRTAPNKPAHTLLLIARFPVVDNLTGLNQLPPAAPDSPRSHRIRDLGAFVVRACARLL
jgi:kynurenine formamidase